MKKLLSVVLALVMVLSLSVVAFATIENEDKTYELELGGLPDDEEGTPDRPGNTYYFTIWVKYDYTQLSDTMKAKILKFYQENTPEYDAFLDTTKTTFHDDVKTGDLLIPYYLTDDEEAKHLTPYIKEHDAKVAESIAIVKKDNVYKVKVVTKASYDTKEYGIDWTITLKKNKTKTVLESNIKFTEQWLGLASYYSDADEEDFEVTMADVNNTGDMKAAGYADSKNKAVIVNLLKNKYNEVHFGETGFWYSVKMSSTSQKVNFYFTEDFKKLYQFFEDADVTGVFLKGTPSIDYKGTFHASFDDDMFVYAVTSADGKLEDLFTWNKEAECWEYNTRAIYGAIVSDVKLDIEAWNKTLTGDASSTTESKGNPGTGSVDFVNLAVALGVVSLAAAGAVVLKRK